MPVIAVDALANEMYQLVAECAGKKNLKAGDITKEMIARHGHDLTKEDCKLAIRQLIDSGRCTYSYMGGSFIVVSPA